MPLFLTSALQVARDLLGARLIRVEDGTRIGGVIIEAEAYRGEEDLGCHAKEGQHAVMAGGLAGVGAAGWVLSSVRS